MVVNGENFSVENLKKNSLLGLLEYLGLSPNRVAIEINGKIISREEINEISLKEDDQIEIIHFAGGG